MERLPARHGARIRPKMAAGGPAEGGFHAPGGPETARFHARAGRLAEFQRTLLVQKARNRPPEG
jgi:hypothetical protein